MEIGDTYDFWFTYWTNVKILDCGRLENDPDNAYALEFSYSETNFVHKTTDISGRERILLSAEQDFLRIFK